MLLCLLSSNSRVLNSRMLRAAPVRHMMLRRGRIPCFWAGVVHGGRIWRLGRVVEGAGFVWAGLAGAAAIGRQFMGRVQVVCGVAVGLAVLGRLVVLGRRRGEGVVRLGLGFVRCWEELGGWGRQGKGLWRPRVG